MDFNDLEMTQVMNVPDDSDDDMDREIRAVLKLHDQDAPAAFQTFNLKPGPNMVGRSRTCDVIIENYAVSKQHAVINVGGRSCTIMDLGSQNKVKIGKRTLKPNCQYNLDYGEEFTIAGLRARVLYDQNNGTNNDTGSDTCSESLLTAIEVALDQEGVDIKTLAGCDTNEKLYLPSAASEHDVGAADAAATSVDVSDHQAAEKSQDSKAHSNEHQSSGSFNLPDMPNLDYTQSDSEQGTEPYMGAGHEPERSQEGAGTIAQAAKVPASDDTPSAKDSRTCTSMQPYTNNAGEQNARDARKFAAADEESRLNAETQPYAERPEVPLLSSLGEGVDAAAADEMERLNAPTQAYEDHESAEAERLNAPTQAYADQDDVERLNAVTQPYAADVGTDDEERLNAVTQSYATDNCDEEEKLNAVTQPYTGSVNDDEERLNAVTQPYTAADISQSEHERMNDVTDSFNKEEDDVGKDSVCAPTQPGERHRRLLTGPSELSFVLCEASQPCREEDEEEEDEEFCAPTQKDESPPLKVHALLKHRRERGPAVEDDKTPPLSPKTTVDETPPPSPGVVPESDPEDDGDTSMVTARHSLPLLDATSATVYEDCVTPGNGLSSPVIGIVSNRRQRRGLSLKKPTCDTVPELPSQESTAGAEWMQQQQQDSSQSKASRKLAYITEVGKDNDLDSGAADAPLAEPLVSGVERTDGPFAATGSSPSIPVKPQESIDANKSPSAEYSEMPFLHMSEDIDLDATATEKEDSTACDTAAEEKVPAEACESGEIPAHTSRPSDDRTLSRDGSKEEQEGTFEKLEPANPSFENKRTSKASPREEEGLADIQTVPEQACEEEEQAIREDEPANDSSESEVESGRATRRRGREKPPARAKRCTRKAASANDAKKAPAENNTVPARRSSGRQNAGSRMKSLLSLEKRTSASGAFKESQLSQEVNEERSTCEDASAKESHEKAGRLRTRRVAKGKAGGKEDELEVAPHHPSESLPSAKESEVASSSDRGNNNSPSVKPGEDETEGKAEAGDSTRVDDNEECQPKAGPSVHQEDVNAEDAAITASPTPSLGGCDVNCTNATIDTCFSEPFPSFSEVMAECQPYIRDTEAQDEKNEPAEEQENTAAEPASESKATAPSVSEPEPEVKGPPRALRSKQPRKGVATRNRKAAEVDEELPTTRRKATRAAQEELLAEAESVAKDPAISVEQPKAPQPASPQPSNRAKRGRPYRTAAGRKAVPSVVDVVPKITEDVRESEGEIEQDTAEDCTISIQQSEAKRLAAPQVSNRARRGRPLRHEAGRNAGPSVSGKIVEYVEQSEGETDPDFAEDRLSGTEQPEAARSAASQQSSRARRGRPFRSAVDRKAVPSTTAPFEDTEDVEQSDGERNADHFSAQETESIEGTLSETSECSTSSRRKAIPSTEVSKATRRGTRRSLQLNAKRGGEEASSESDTEHLSAQDTESIHGTPLNSSEILLSKSEALPRASARRNAKNAKLSLQQEKEQADHPASEGATAESTEEPSQNARPQRGRTSAKTRSEREGGASYVAAVDDSLECVELSQSPRTSKPKRGAKQSQVKDEPFVQSMLDDSTNSSQTEANSQTSRSSQRGRRNANKPETQESFATEESQDGPPFPSTLDDSTQSLPTVSHSQSSRGSLRRRRDSKQLEMQDLSPKETEGAHVKNALDDSTQSLSVESHSKTSQGAKQGKRNANKPKTRNLTPEGTDDMPRVQGALDDSMQLLSTECQSQNSRSSRQGRRNAKQPETLNNATPEETEVQNEEEAHDAKPLRRGQKAPKLSSKAGSRASASVGEINIASADHEPKIRRTRRGADTGEPSSRNEQVRLTPETAEVEPSEKTTAEVEPRSVPPRRGRKAAKRGGSKNVPEDDAVTETFEAPEPANLKSSKAPRTTNLSLHKPTTADTKVLIKVESPSPRASKRSGVKTAQIPSEDTEQRNNGDPAKVSSRSKRKVTKVETVEDVTAETEAEAQSSESTSRSPTSRMPALAMTVTRKRDARRAGKKDNPSQTTSASVLETSAETSPQCPMQRVSRKRPVASMSFGEARPESDDEAADTEQETLDEIVVKPGLKSRRKELVKEAAVKQEVVEKAPAKRGKRKADVPEAKTEVPQEAKTRRDEQAHSFPAPKKTAKVKPKVLFTGIDDTKVEEQVVRDLGGIIATNPSVCTHLVTDKFRRTVKALCCIGKGTPIVDVAWIKKCREAGAFVDHVPHILLDKKAEKALNFNLRDTLTKASTGGVLRGWTVHATAHVLPSPGDMKEIVACAGGKYLDNLPTRTTAGTTVVISCKEDLKACARARNYGIPVVAAEFILSGLLRHSLDLDAHRLE